MKLPLRQLLLVLLGAVLLYGAFVVYTGYRTVTQSVVGFEWSAFAAALALSSMNYLLRFAKWEYYLARLSIRGIPKFDSFLIFLSGFVLTVTPGKVGEVFKSAVLARIHRVPGHLTAPIVIAERLTDVIAVVGLILVGSLALPGGLTWAIMGTLAVAVALGLVYWPVPVRTGLQWLRRTSAGFLAPKLEQAFEQLRQLATPRLLVVPTLLSCVGWACEGFALSIILSGFGETIGVFPAIFFYSTATLAGALIPVPGGLGVTDALIQQQLVRLAAVTAGHATTAMLLIRVATLWWAVVVGFVALAILRWRFGPGLHGRPSRRPV